MFARTKLFTRLIMQEQREEEAKKAQTAGDSNWIESLVKSIEKSKYDGEAKHVSGTEG